MKKLTVLLFLINYTISFAQDLNGIYPTAITTFTNPSNSSKNFTEITEDYIIVDYNEIPEPQGFITLSTKTEENETINYKFRLLGDKEVDFKEGSTYIKFTAKINALNIEIKDKTYEIILIYEQRLKYIIIFFPGGAHQLWELKNKI